MNEAKREIDELKAQLDVKKQARMAAGNSGATYNGVPTDVIDDEVRRSSASHLFKHDPLHT